MYRCTYDKYLSMGNQNQKIQRFTWMADQEVHLSKFKDCLFIFDLFNDLGSFNIIQCKELFYQNRREEALKVLLKHYTIRTCVLFQYNIKSVYTWDMNSPKKFLQTDFEQKKDLNQFVSFFLQSSIGILQMFPTGFLPAIYEADHEVAFLYKYYTNKRFKCYAVSSDGDCFYLQVPQIKIMYLLLPEQDLGSKPDARQNRMNNKKFAYVKYFDYSKGPFESDKLNNCEIRGLRQIYNNKIKLALMKVLLGTKTLQKLKLTSFKPLIPILNKYQLIKINGIKGIIDQIVEDLDLEQRKCRLYISKQKMNEYKQRVEIQTMYWLCASVNNPYDQINQFLDNQIAKDYVRRQLTEYDGRIRDRFYQQIMSKKLQNFRKKYAGPILYIKLNIPPIKLRQSQQICDQSWRLCLKQLKRQSI